MAEETANPSEEPKKKSSAMIIVVLLLVLIIVGVLAFFFLASGGEEGGDIQEERKLVEYPVPGGMFQLKNGSYLKLSFSIVVDEKFVPIVKDIIEVTSPARLSDGLNSILGNKTREDLIGSSLRRENFRLEIKKMLETYVFQEYNRKQRSPKDMIEVREILLQSFVTQQG